MNSIKWTPKAFKQLRKLDHQIQTVIRDSVGTLEAMPNCHNVKSHTNHGKVYRLRDDKYRVRFNGDDEIKVIKIEEVKKRDERTY
ncbi:type II toxin-antitoxin system RelE/ParE family toxin [Pseudomonas sp. MWU12-2534b]|nr:type II toxin-antitoxin system RelE/ParE family toxin [Pseudomonas sp. MWU12-2534b]